MQNKVLDNDFYKFTMQQAVFMNYGDVDVEYVFINRGGEIFTPSMLKEIKFQIDNICNSYGITEDAFQWIQKQCPDLKRPYLHYLKHYRFDKNEVHIKLTKEGELQLTIKGPMFSAILWEVPLLSIISEVYSKETYGISNSFFLTDRTWMKKLNKKIKFFNDNGIYVADFGTRRRLMFALQAAVVATLVEKVPTFVGTSNVLLAYTNGIKPIGTHAHEWFMLHQGLFGTQIANSKALEVWQKQYRGSLGIALTDTFTTDAFFKSFDSYFARLFDGVRHDSWDPLEFLEKVINHYESLNIDPKSKTIVFSDGLNIDKIKKIKDAIKSRIKHSYGIGTNLTNDAHDDFTPLRIVIKLSKVNGKDVVKISDEKGKNTGKLEAIKNTNYEIAQMLKG